MRSSGLRQFEVTENPYEKNHETCFLFYLESSFCFQDI